MGQAAHAKPRREYFILVDVDPDPQELVGDRGDFLAGECVELHFAAPSAPLGAEDEQHMVSAVDMLPTLLDIAGIPHPPGLQGRSLVPLLKGESQSGRDMAG